MRIRISFPEDRDYAGRLEVLDGAGVLVLGPFPAAGRAHEQSAAQHGNPLRDPLLPYGDTPIGAYAVRGVAETGAGVTLDSQVFGVHGVVLLEPVSGQAALADAQGRFRFFIQGGGGEAGLRATAGAVRLLDRDQEQLVALMRRTAERVVCEIVATADRGAKLLPAPAPPDTDPPMLPERPRVATQSPRLRPAADPGSPFLLPAAAQAVRSAPRFFVAVERSGSGGTGYGQSGGDPGASNPGDGSGGTSLGSGGDGGVSGGGDATSVSNAPDQPIVTDASPVTGVDLAPQQQGVADNSSGASQLLSTAPQTGLSNPYGPTQAGWVVSPPPVDSYTNGPVLSGGSLTAYAGDEVGTYSGASADMGVTNNYTGTQNVQTYSDSANASSPMPVDASIAATYSGPFQPDMGVHDATQAEIDAMVARFAQSDAQLLAQQNQLAADPSTGGISSGPFTPSAPLQNQTLNTSSPAPGAGSSAPPPGWLYSQAAATGVLGGYQYVPGPTIEQFNLPAVELPSFDVAVRASGYPLPSTGSPVASHVSVDPDPLGRGFTASNPAGTATPAEHALGNLSTEVTNVYEGVPYRYSVTQNSPYIALSGNVEKAAFGNYDFEGERYLVNLESVGPGTSIIRNDTIISSVQDYAAANPSEASRAQTYVNNQAVEQEIFARSTIPPEAVSPLSDAKTTLQAWTESPPTLGGALPQSALRGAGFGAGVSTAFQIGQMAFSGQQYSAGDYATAGGRTFVAGGVSGAVGSSIDTAITQSLASGGEVSLLGRVAGGGLGGGPAAAIFQVGSMYLSDQQYSETDYLAKGTRAGVEGALSGALAAGVVGAIWGTEVPILGNAVGFAVGFLGYLAIDYIAGDTIEEGVRSLDNPVGDFPVNQNPSAQDPGGFFSPTDLTLG